MILSMFFCTGISVVAAEDDVLSYLTYEHISSSWPGTGISITDCDTSISGDVVIPETIDGEPVINIASQAFHSCHNITSITFPDTVKSLSSSAISFCNSLKTVYIGTKLSSFSNDYFSKSVECIYIDENNPNLTSDEYGVVYNKNKTELRVYPKSNRQTVYSIPETVTKISSTSFSSNLAFIDVEDNNTAYSNDEFGVLFNKDKTELIRYPQNSMYTEYTIPDSVVSTAKNAFENCTNLEKVTIGKAMTAVSSYSFSGCTALTQVEMHNNIISIGQNAFANCISLTEMNIPESVEAISISTFYGCTGLKNIKIPNHIKTIGNSAFYGCTGLETVEISDSVTTIGSNVFRNCSNLTDVIVSKNLTSIGEFVFSGCTNLEFVTLPDMLTNIPQYAFYNCTALTEVKLPANLETIGNYAFSDCSIKEIQIPESVTTLGEFVFSGNNIKNLVIPSNIKIIPHSAFYYCEKLSEVIISEGVTTIDNYAFYHSSVLETIVIPQSVTTIGSMAFSSCTKLKDITILNPECSIYDSANTINSSAIIHGYSDSTAESYATKYSRTFEPIDKDYESYENITYVIKDGAITIVAFDELSEGEITVPSEINETPVSAIGNGTFVNCPDVTSVTFNDKSIIIYDSETTIPAHITIVGYKGSTAEAYAAKYTNPFICLDGDDILNHLKYSITNGEAKITGFYSTISGIVEIPETINGCPVTTIAGGAFRGCTTITRVIIPDSITSIASTAFRECKNLVSIVLPEKLQKISNSTFYFCTALRTVSMPSELTEIEDSAFRNCAVLEEISIPEGVTTIGDAAFCDCRSLESLDLPESLETIGEWAFTNCYNITEIEIPDNVKSIGDTAFSSCYANVKIGKGLSYIHPNAFSAAGISRFDVDENNLYYSNDKYGVLFNKNKTELLYYSGASPRSVYTVPDSVTVIGEKAFYNCSALKNISLPDSLQVIGKNSFASCSFTEFFISSRVTTINDKAFDGCEKITKFTVDTDNQYYSNDETGVLFDKNKTNLIQYPLNNSQTEYNIPAGVTMISDSAFNYSKKLEKISVPEGVTSLGDFTFNGCFKLVSIALPDTLTEIKYQVFGYCYELKDIVIPKNVTTIGTQAFIGCKKLESIVLPVGVETVGSGAFNYCSSLSSITILNPNCQINDDANTIYSSATIYGYPGSTAESYATNYNRTFVALEAEKEYEVFESFTYEVIDGKIKIIACDKEATGEIIIPESIGEYPVTAIGEDAFDGCVNVTAVIINDTDVEIFDSETTIPENITINGYTGSTAESYATKYSRTFVSLDEEEEDDENTGVFGNLTYEITDNGVIITGCDETAENDIIIPDEIEGYPVVGISPDVFSGCASITEVIIPASVKVIEANVFSGCTSLKKVVATGVESIGSTAFSGCTSLDTFITFADALEIAADSFDSSENLTVFVKDTTKVTAPATLNIITFSIADGTLSFSGEYKSDLYYLFDLIAVMCSYYDDVQYLFFDSFEAVSDDEGHIYYYTENGQREEFDGTKASNVKFSVEAFDSEGELRKFSFNELCTAVANDEISNFFIIIEDADGLDKGDIEMSLVDHIHQGLTRILKAIVNLLNKLFSFFKSIGVK